MSLPGVMAIEVVYVSIILEIGIAYDFTVVFNNEGFYALDFISP
jgi:hypothetical protein